MNVGLGLLAQHQRIRMRRIKKIKKVKKDPKKKEFQKKLDLFSRSFFAILHSTSNSLYSTTYINIISKRTFVFYVPTETIQNIMPRRQVNTHNNDRRVSRNGAKKGTH